MTALSDLGSALWALSTPMMLFHVAWSMLLGIVVGALPGLTATMGVALMVTLTYSMDTTAAILVLICMYVGAIYGGSRSAILLNIPGTPASAATSLDGYPLARAGRAGQAMGLATAGSMLGTLVGILVMVMVAPLLAELALEFGSYEMFWLAVFGVLISGQLTVTNAPVKGYIAGILGLMVAMIGSEGLHAYVRFSPTQQMNGGIGLIPAMVGVFGLAEVMTAMWQRQGVLAAARDKSDRIVPSFGEVWRYRATVLRSGVIGTIVGVIPGVGEDIGAWASYATAKRLSKKPEEYGQGSTEGLIAAETGNSAVVPGSLIPALTLAVPGSASAAVLIAALFIHGIRPGPMIMIEQPQFISTMGAILILAVIAMTIYGITMTRLFVQVLRVPYAYLMPLVFTLCVVGTYALSQRMFDVYVMIIFGLAGFVLRQMKYPMAPLVLGIILGTMLDTNLRRSLMLGNGDLWPFVTRPISAVFVAIIVMAILLNFGFTRRFLAGIRARVMRRTDA
ncbi:tripartite tricarboxylate transporter permease [Roseisalinus antarcticus]|uniref:Tripartite tricarboxylate transporter TctA family protein n=1 Tax=Roseisalinus antarcticus TaxID=254357 RepID=A0A1Y5TCN0_9RHOB|nr:tripartite tricarboxylate transporter permease [Roseisalinus antarcticus]SLN61073.1 Tripartite tricarboxylate transporter TctA family protein [Roseisalinus antarcticus]